MALGNDRPRNGGGVGGAHAELNVFMLMCKITYKLKSNFGGMGDSILIAPSDGVNTLAFESIAHVDKQENRDWRSYDDQDGKEIARGTSQFDCIRKTIMKRYTP